KDVETRSRVKRFRYSCCYCLFHRDPYEDNYEKITTINITEIMTHSWMG
ncbi:hypothetical protein DBR06_SOUSAS23910002, partial [Sousa chinensis]